LIGIYCHIPFCSAICHYCNFNRGLVDPALVRRYLTALEAEIAAPDTPGVPAAAAGRQADSIFFGGGTPSLLEPADVGRLISAFGRSFALASETEATLETNPETATPERLDGFRRSGVNRISFGVQSFDPGELARLGRVHSADRARTALRDARAAGFDNVSLDLMFWLPGQSLESWLATVDQAIALEPDHLSLYLLELYPNAPLKDAMARAGREAPAAWRQAADDEAADMYLAALDRLDAAGFSQYEISNVARPGRSCRHNLKYWEAGEWRGFGCGAHSTVGGVRWMNVASTADYCDRMSSSRAVATGERRLTADEGIEEALITGLRLTSGIDRGNFQARHGVDPWARYGEALSLHLDSALVWQAGGRFGLSRRGMLVANEILLAFV
jgi:oxygen-independent coproporphyrinogen-3 oxidase